MTCKPFVCPITGGGVQLEWNIGNRHLELEFAPDGCLTWLTEQEGGTMDTGECPFRDTESTYAAAEKVKALLSWVTGEGL